MPLAASAASSGPTITKRDGRRVQFDVTRISDALDKAFNEVYGPATPDRRRVSEITDRVRAELVDRFPEGAQIYEVQNVVEHALLDSGEHTVAQAYVTYRLQRDLARSRATDINESVHALIGGDVAVVNENANKDASVFNTQRDLTAGTVAKAIGLTMLPPHVANAHQKGDLHFHDLDYHPYAPMTNCSIMDIPGMLGQGFRMGNAEMETPRSIGTAVAQISQIIANVASNQYGGVTFNRADEALEPYALLTYTKNLRDSISLIAQVRGAPLTEEALEQEVQRALATSP